MQNQDLEWSGPDVFPEELNSAHNGLSVDVLVETKAGEHSIGWFDFNKIQWQFLSNETITKFKWRYLSEKIDRWTRPGKKSHVGK